MQERIKIIVASGNTGKIKEIEEILREDCFEVLSMLQANITLDIKENQADFASNALLKARAIQTALKQKDNILILSDDSGLCVEELNLEPGVFSARYANYKKGRDSNSSDLENNLLLIEELKKKKLKTSRAYFVASMVLLGRLSGKEVQWSVEERCEGRVFDNQKGSNGFGYDSLFEPLGFDKRMAEISIEQKNQISHRSKALRKIISQLKDFLHV